MPPRKGTVYTLGRYDEEAVTSTLAGTFVRLSPADRQEVIRRMLLAGEATAAIAARAHCKVATVYNAAKRERARGFVGSGAMPEIPKPARRTRKKPTKKVPETRERIPTPVGLEVRLMTVRGDIASTARRLARTDPVKQPAKHRALMEELGRCKSYLDRLLTEDHGEAR